MLTLNNSQKTKFLKNVKNTSEIETKFFNKDLETIELLKSYLLLHNYKKNKEQTLDYIYDDGTRVTVYEDGVIENTTKTVKFYLGSKSIDDLKYTVSEEKKEKLLVFDKKYKIERKKNRLSFSKDNDRID